MRAARCPICAADMPSNAKFCPKCGSLPEAETLTSVLGIPRSDSRPPTSSDYDFIGFPTARFFPGQNLAAPYRIVLLQRRTRIVPECQRVRDVFNQTSC